MTAPRLAAAVLALTAGLTAFLLPPPAAADVPTVSSIAITSNAGEDGYYKIGDTVTVRVTFSKSVTLTGDQTTGKCLLLDVILDHLALSNSTLEIQNCHTATGTRHSFKFDVDEGEFDADGISFKQNPLRLAEGATVQDSDGHNANLNRAAISARKAHKVDGVRPGIAFVGGTPAAGAPYAVRLTDAHSGVAKYAVVEVAGTATDASGCDDPSADGFTPTELATAASSKAVTHTPDAEGKKLCVYAEDAAGNGKSALLAAIGPALASDPARRPTVTGFTMTSSPAAESCYKAGETISFVMSFSEPVNITANDDGKALEVPLIMGVSLTSRSPFFHSTGGTQSGVSGVAFSGTVPAGQEDPNGLSILPDTLRLMGGATVRDSDGNNLYLGHAGLTDQSGHKVCTATTDPTTAVPVVDYVHIVSHPPLGETSGTYYRGHEVQVAVVFDLPVRLTPNNSGKTVRLSVRQLYT